MANKRAFLAQGLVTNGVSVGGLASMDFAADYADVIESPPSSAFGVEDVDRGGLKIDVSMSCSDVMKANGILGSTPGVTTYSGKESGLTTYKDYTTQQIVWSGMDMSLAKNADGKLDCKGALRFADNTTTLANAIAVASAAVGAPPLVTPVRLYRPNTASFDPDGAGLAIPALHAESVRLSLSGNVIQNYGDDDIGHTAVDLQSWGALKTTLTFRDASDAGGSDIASQLMAAVRGVLTVVLLGRGASANKTLTINNLLWTGVQKKQGDGYFEFTMSGASGWKSAATLYDMAGAPLFAIA